MYTNQRLSLSKLWEGPRMTCQGFKPDSGNPTVRHYRGASGTVRHGETVTPFRNRKSGNGNPSPTARRARFLSRPSSTIHSMAPRCPVRRRPPHHVLWKCDRPSPYEMGPLNRQERTSARRGLANGDVCQKRNKTTSDNQKRCAFVGTRCNRVAARSTPRLPFQKRCRLARRPTMGELMSVPCGTSRIP